MTHTINEGRVILKVDSDLRWLVGLIEVNRTSNNFCLSFLNLNIFFTRILAKILRLKRQHWIGKSQFFNFTNFFLLSKKFENVLGLQL